MIRDMYASNQMDEEIIKRRIVEEVDTKRFPADHQFHVGRLGQA